MEVEGVVDGGGELDCIDDLEMEMGVWAGDLEDTGGGTADEDFVVGPTVAETVGVVRFVQCDGGLDAICGVGGVEIGDGDVDDVGPGGELVEADVFDGAEEAFAIVVVVGHVY